MIIYVMDAGNGVFEAFSSKREAEKCQRELNDAGRGEEPQCNGHYLTITKHNIKTKEDMIGLLNLFRGGWDALN